MSSNGFSSPLSESTQPGFPTGALAPISTPEQTDWVFLGSSMAVRQLRSQVQRIAPYFRTALIRGEAGAGKELVARHLHRLSPGSNGTFVVARAAAIADSVATSRATHPASVPEMASLLESAKGGTLYLEGAGDLSPDLQVGLLNFLRACDERRAVASHNPRQSFDPSGPRRCDIRILAASDRDLRTLSAIGQFRPDLYARLAAVEIFVPALRQRSEDLPELAYALLRQFVEQTGQDAKLLAESTMAALQRPLWANNLRELERVLAHAAALTEGAVIEPHHLPASYEPAGAAPVAASAARPDRLHDVIQQHVLAVLMRCGGNKLRAAEVLGISRSTLYRMLDASPAAGRLD